MGKEATRDQWASGPRAVGAAVQQEVEKGLAPHKGMRKTPVTE